MNNNEKHVHTELWGDFMEQFGQFEIEQCANIYLFKKIATL